MNGIGALAGGPKQGLGRGGHMSHVELGGAVNVMNQSSQALKRASDALGKHSTQIRHATALLNQ